MMAQPVINSINPSGSAVEQYGKLEIELDITAIFTNPYDYDQIEVWADFTAPDSQIIRVDGFFMEDFILNANGSLTPDGEGFKIRFAPMQIGNWSYQIFVKDNAGTISSSVMSFACQAASSAENHGFLRTGQTNYLQFDDGEQFITVGENMCWQNNNAYLDYKNWLDKMKAKGGNSWETGEKVVASILPGGKHHRDYVQKLDLFSEFVKDLRVGFLFKKDIPVIFRPFHEHTGNWFWWGNDHCTAEEYKQIWRFTVEYLRDKKGLHNLLYAYSPDIFRDKAHYLERYPGDEYVDILGLDDYHDLGANGKTEDLLRRLRMLVELAESKGKVAAMTETGFESIPRADWWTANLLNPIKNDPVASRIAWVLVWRNARPSHHYAPYPGHISAEDFIRFSQDSFVGFGGDFPGLYRKN